MAKLVAHMRLIAGALALAFIVAISAPWGDYCQVSVPVSAQQPNTVNPTADAVKEQQLFHQLKRFRAASPFRTRSLPCLFTRLVASGAIFTP